MKKFISLGGKGNHWVARSIRFSEESPLLAFSLKSESILVIPLRRDLQAAPPVLLTRKKVQEIVDFGFLGQKGEKYPKSKICFICSSGRVSVDLVTFPNRRRVLKHDFMLEMTKRENSGVQIEFLSTLSIVPKTGRFLVHSTILNRRPAKMFVLEAGEGGIELRAQMDISLVAVRYYRCIEFVATRSGKDYFLAVELSYQGRSVVDFYCFDQKNGLEGQKTQNGENEISGDFEAEIEVDGAGGGSMEVVNRGNCEKRAIFGDLGILGEVKRSVGVAGVKNISRVGDSFLGVGAGKKLIEIKIGWGKYFN